MKQSLAFMDWLSGRVPRATGHVLGGVLGCVLLAGAAFAAKPDKSLADEGDARNWAAYGRTYNETHFSPLAEINRDTVSRLRLAWTLDLDLVGTTQSTPLAVDGVLYIAAGYSIVHAVDAQTGKLLWRVDTDTLTLAHEKLRVGAGIRGLAYRKGPFSVVTDGKIRAGGPANQAQLFVGTHDGRLVALDAAKGTYIWSKQILGPDRTFISGAPRLCGERVLIGFGAGAGQGVSARGFVTARDVVSGEELWRWHSVPDRWTGGAVWNSIVCDPSVNRVYVGVGEIRDPQPAAIAGQLPHAGAVVALDATNGHTMWEHRADAGAPFPASLAIDASLDITLATLTIDGAARRVLLHAPKDGWFYVIDRDTGRRISARKLGMGVHTLAPQAFSPKSGLVYLPTMELTPPAPGTYAAADATRGFIVGWDPVKQRVQWAQPTPGGFAGGVLATAGDLVFQGQADGYFVGYAADGKKAWQYYAASAALGTPISFALGTKQYLALLVGPPTGSAASLGAPSAKFGWDSRLHPRRLIAFTLDGTAALPPTPPPTPAQPLDGPDIDVDETLVKLGAERFVACQWCHGAGAIAGGMAPDLRASTVPLDETKFTTIVKGGNEARGMPKFEEFTARDLESLRHFIRARARADTRPGGVAPPPPPPPEQKPAEEPDVPKPPPGSLQSEGVPPPQ